AETRDGGAATASDVHAIDVDTDGIGGGTFRSIVGAHDMPPGAGDTGGLRFGEVLVFSRGRADGEAPVGGGVARVQRVLAARRAGAVDVLGEGRDAFGFAGGGVHPGGNGQGACAGVQVHRRVVRADLVPVGAPVEGLAAADEGGGVVRGSCGRRGSGVAFARGVRDVSTRFVQMPHGHETVGGVEHGGAAGLVR